MDSPLPLLVVAVGPCAHSAAVAISQRSNLSGTEASRPVAAVIVVENAGQRRNSAVGDPVSGASELVAVVVVAPGVGASGLFGLLVTTLQPFQQLPPLTALTAAGVPPCVAAVVAAVE